jgi:CheY-like chemotaxis protein
MRSPKTILLVSTDEALRTTRQKILELVGYDVTAVAEWHALESACLSHSFDLIILGQSLLPSFKRDAAAFVREHCPDTAILEIYIATPDLNNGTHRFHATSPLDPTELITAVAKALGESTEKAAAP